jgi:hypothetical protein
VASAGAGASRWALAEDAVLEIAGADAVDEQRGGESGGWRSARYGAREPLVTLRARRRGALPCEMTSQLRSRAGCGDTNAFGDDVATFREWMRSCAA